MPAKKLKKDLIFCKLKKAQKNMNLILCKVRKAEKHGLFSFFDLKPLPVMILILFTPSKKHLIIYQHNLKTKTRFPLLTHEFLQG